MAKRTLNKIFLSASIPYLGRKKDKLFYNTADIIAIRDAVRALATVAIPNSLLIWGGHPAITPLIKEIMTRMNSDFQEHVTLYQSGYYRKFFPEDNEYFEGVKIIPENQTESESIFDMRMEMIRDNNFKAGIFIGGMNGVIEEYNYFKEYHPNVPIYPIASTGAAAKVIFDEEKESLDQRLLTDYAYMSLFRDLLNNII